MLRLRYKLKASLVAALGTLITIAIVYPKDIASKKYHQRQVIKNEFKWLKKDFDLRLGQLSSFFDKQDQLDVSCDRKTLLTLRRAHFQIPNVSEFGMMDPHGYLICASWGKVSPAIKTSGPKPIEPGVLRFFGPIHTDLVGEAGLVIAKTRSDGYEMNALLPQSILYSHLQDLDSKYTYAAIVDSITGVPLSLVGKYALPINQQMFPLTQKLQQEGSQFDDLSQHFLIAEPLKNLPKLTIMVAIDQNVLYNNIYSPSFVTLFLCAASFISLFFLTKSYQELYKSRKSKLLHAMKTGQFINYYQLIWDAKYKKFVGMETLVRQVHPVEGLLSPDRFLPEIEQNSLNVPLTNSVIDNIFKEISLGIIPCDSLKVNINITGEHLKDPEFHEKIIALKAKIPQLVLELTETELVEMDDQVVINAIQNIKDHQILLAIDDFGTGYAGLQYLRELPFDILKIDRSFVSAIGTESHLSKMLDVLIDLANKLDLDIVAEGVETQTQANYLVEKGVYLHQGWLYHKAAPINQLPLQ